VPIAELAERLRRMFAARDDHVLFFDADDAVEYGFAVEVMDQAREGGAVTIAALTSALTAPDKPASP
jgi:biopolymer transport protein ExbD